MQSQLSPKVGEHNVLITAALPYVNNVPHLGNIIGSVLSADVYARFRRLQDFNVLFVCGTDEYGTATETKAQEEGLSPQEICNKFYELHKNIYEWFDISFDCFGRTTLPEHVEVCQTIFSKLKENGYVFTDSVEQLFCESCSRALADRFVEGKCPHCGYEDARGDQCDECSKLINAIDLKDPRCKTCRNTPKLVFSDHYFINLPILQPEVKTWLAFVQNDWSPNATAIANSWLLDDLKPRCITRDLKWGVPVPGVEKVFYVWFDAPIGYISITKHYCQNWELWWKTNECDVELVQFMAKDNVPFHSVLFPSYLVGSKNKYRTVNKIYATEYLKYENQKFSKSRGVGIFGNDVQDLKIPSDVWRFYLLYIRPETQDSTFLWSDFQVKVNSELLNNLGNFINRTLKLTQSQFGNKVPKTDLQLYDELVSSINTEINNYVLCLGSGKLREGVKIILKISKLGNQFLQEHKPWTHKNGSEEDKKVAGNIMGVCCNLVYVLSVLLKPYMPKIADSILLEQLKVTDTISINKHLSFVAFMKEGHELGVPKPLFTKIDDLFIEDCKKKFGGT